jgi:hypothetical protein
MQQRRRSHVARYTASLLLHSRDMHTAHSSTDARYTRRDDTCATTHDTPSHTADPTIALPPHCIVNAVHTTAACQHEHESMAARDSTQRRVPTTSTCITVVEPAASHTHASGEYARHQRRQRVTHKHLSHINTTGRDTQQRRPHRGRCSRAHSHPTCDTTATTQPAVATRSSVTTTATHTTRRHTREAADSHPRSRVDLQRDHLQ